MFIHYKLHNNFFVGLFTKKVIYPFIKLIPLFSSPSPPHQDAVLKA